MRFNRRWAAPVAIGVIILAGLIYAFLPQAVPADFATVERGAMMVTVRDEGETRVKEIYQVSAPLSGRVLRFEGDVGDQVRAGETVLVTIEPTEPNFLDVRTRREAEAAVNAAEAARGLAEAEVTRLQAMYDFAEAEYQRAAALVKRGTISQSQADRARMEAQTQQAALQEAKAGLRVREFELETARAALLNPGDDPSDNPSDICCFPVFAPVDGNILQIFRESEGVIGAGTPLVEIGDPRNLEIVVDLLSTDAVKVREGDTVLIEAWGGEGTLNGRVRRVEPYGFTKVSALGIEEQRVNVIVDITDPFEKWARLGHGYRVEAEVILWKGEKVLQVPIAALFRRGANWAVFAVVDDEAVLTEVEIGRMNSTRAEVLSGLEEGSRIVIHPSDRVEDGTPIVERTL